MEYDLAKPKGKQVVSSHILCSECNTPKYELLEDDQMYYVLMSSFMIQGGDGYDMITPEALDILSFGECIYMICKGLLIKKPVQYM